MTIANVQGLVALRFHEALNHRDLAGLAALMSENHRFIDSAGQRVDGRDAVRDAWRQFFAAFPDYRNHVETLLCREQTVVMTGRSSCSEPALAGPAFWRADIVGGLVEEWRVLRGPQSQDSRRLHR
jgi:ketosteroid isomerase-like protein